MPGMVLLEPNSSNWEYMGPRRIGTWTCRMYQAVLGSTTYPNSCPTSSGLDSGVKISIRAPALEPLRLGHAGTSFQQKTLSN